MIMNIRRFGFVCFTVALCLFIQSVPAATVYAVTVEAGDRAPLFNAQTLDGEKFVLKEHLGKNVVLLNFWSVFCRDCISRIEALNKINDLFSQRSFELVGIAGDPPTARMLSQVKKYAAKMHYDVILDPELEVFDSYGVEIIPFAVLVDRDGTVVVAIQSLEPEPLKQISEAIDRLTKE
jgi:peroxiredoxin